MKTVTEHMNDPRILNDPDMTGALEPIVGQVHYYVMCISAFAKAKGINVKDAFNYLHAYKGIEFLIECYDAEHTLSLENAVEDLTRICGNNGGNIA